MTDDAAGRWNIPMKTLGGQQFWSDVRIVGGWRVQRNSHTGHFRLLDVGDTRIAWGSQAACDEELNQRLARGEVKPDSGKIVILLHGLVRSADSMNAIAAYLQTQGGYTIVNFQYASSREAVEIHAQHLKSVIDGLGNEVTEINFVGHSLGNIVVRHYLGDCVHSGQPRDARISRMVMLGPPNQGSKMARLAKNSYLFKTVAGASGAQLSLGWEQLETKLAVPDFQFGIIAGGQEEGAIVNNFFLPDKNDFTVSLAEAKLAGAHDLLVQPLLHSTMMNQAEVLAATLHFLQEGSFVSEAQRQPIAADWKK